MTNDIDREKSAVENKLVELIKCTSRVTSTIKRNKRTATKRLQLQQCMTVSYSVSEHHGV